MNLTPEQYELMFTAVRRYQFEKCITDSHQYHQCDIILNELFPIVYTQRQEQPT
jgi:hypothetical protein